VRVLVVLALAGACDRGAVPPAPPPPVAVVTAIDAAVPHGPVIAAGVELPEVAGGDAVPDDAQVISVGSDGVSVGSQRIVALGGGRFDPAAVEISGDEPAIPKLRAAVGGGQRYTLVAIDRRLPIGLLDIVAASLGEHATARTVHVAVALRGQIRALAVTYYGDADASSTPLVLVGSGRIFVAATLRADKLPITDRAALDARLGTLLNAGTSSVVQFDSTTTADDAAPIIALMGRRSLHVHLWWDGIDATPREREARAFADLLTVEGSEGGSGHRGRPADLGEQVEDARHRGSAAAK
jgi:hypothetical protein